MPAKGYGLAGQIDGYLTQKGSPLAGMGSVFVASGRKYGVDPRLTVAISGAESSFGKHLFQPYNAWGWMSGDTYGSWQQSINAVTQGIYNGYIAQGLKTPAEIVSKWAPASDGNDESVWSGNVSTFMRELGASPAGTTAKTVVSPSPPPAATVPTGKFTLPPIERSTAGIRSALISNLGLVGQRGHASGTGLLASVLQGQLQDVQTDEANQAQQAAYLAALKSAAPAAAPEAAPATSDTSTAAPTPTSIPVSGKVIGTPYAGTHTLGNWESDNAVDIAVPEGTPVRAVADGVIGPQFGALGSGDPRFAGLRLHLASKGNEFYYAHLSRFAQGIKPGVRVRAGEILGYSGSANGVEHLHFGQKNGNPEARYEG